MLGLAAWPDAVRRDRLETGEGHMSRGRRHNGGWGLVVGGLTGLLVVGSLLAGCVTISARTQARDTVSLSLDVPAGTTTRVETFNGPIEVSSSGGSQVQAEVERRSEGADAADAEANRDAIEVSLELVDGAALLRAVYTPNPQSIPGGSGAAVTLRVPASTALQLVTSNGPIAVVDTAAGLAARTSNGPVRLSGVADIISVDTSNGPVSVEASEPVVLDVRTSNGGITVDGALAPGESVLETSNGAVELQMPADAAFSIDASTSAARASSEFVIDGSTGESTLQGTVGAPGVAAETTVRIRSSNGAITLRKG
jgi:hypothetical protein